MWELVLVAVLAVLIGCWSFEMGLVVALCGVLAGCMTSGGRGMVGVPPPVYPQRDQKRPTRCQSR